MKNDIIQLVIQLTEVEWTTWSIMLKSRPSGQMSGRLGSFFGFSQIDSDINSQKHEFMI